MESRHMFRIRTFHMGTMLAVFLLLAASSACSNVLGTKTERFIIAVNDISVPDTIAPGETLNARFAGNIGPDGCSRLDRVERNRSAGLLELRFHGIRKLDVNTDCTLMQVKLEHVEHLLPPIEDPFMIRVIQPDGSALERVVRVR